MGGKEMLDLIVLFAVLLGDCSVLFCSVEGFYKAVCLLLVVCGLVT